MLNKNNRNKKVVGVNHQRDFGRKVFIFALCVMPCFAFAADPFGFDGALGMLMKWLSSDTSLIVGGLALVGAFIALIFMDFGAVVKIILRIVVGIGGAMSVSGLIAAMFGAAGAVIH